MRIYQVPVQLEREEKMFGGSISLRKMIYLVVCVLGLGSVGFITIYKTGAGLEIAFLVWGLFFIFGWVLAFGKIRAEYDLDKYLLMRARYELSVKEWPFYGGGGHG